VDWLDWTGWNWFQPNVAHYRDYLTEEGLAPSTVSAYLSTVRGRYGATLSTNDEELVVGEIDGRRIDWVTDLTGSKFG